MRVGATKVIYGVAMLVLVAITAWALATRNPEPSPEERPVYYVATDGDDEAPGTESEPWASLQKAADEALPGSTVYVRGGVYPQRVDIRVSGSETDGPVTFAAYPGEQPVLDGESLSVPAEQSAMIAIDSQRFVTVEGFEIRGYRSDQSGHVPTGILVTGAADHITIEGNHVHDMGTSFPGRSGGDAFGIAVYGTSATHPISDLRIEGNEVDHLGLGSSESLVVNGNVDGFVIADNTVHDNNNIGIDVIGFEGTAPDPTVDQARNGVVRGNLVYNIDSRGNPAYGQSRSADGIYVDGGRDVLVESNVIHDVNIGLEFASEHGGRATRNITARNNVVTNSSTIGLAIGGYDRRRGSTEGCVIVHNTFSGSDGVELLIQFDTRDNLIANNIVDPDPGVAYLENPYEENEGNVIDHNVFGTGGGSWEWKGITYDDLDAYRAASRNDRHSVMGDPLFVDPQGGDYTLQEGSPAVDMGAYLPMGGAVDAGGNDRASGGIPDAGAFERAAPPPSPTPSIAGDTVYPSDLEWVVADNGWGPAERDMSNGEKPEGDGLALMLNGDVFERGIGAHAPSRIALDLGGACTAFLADVGLDDEVGDRGTVVFEVLGDGEVIATSGLVVGSQGSLPVLADVTDVQRLELVVRAGGDGNGWDHADWGDARLDCASSPPS